VAALVGAALAAGYGGAFLPRTAAARQARGRRRWAAALARALPWTDVPAWAATALLVAQPLLQLVRRLGARTVCLRCLPGKSGFVHMTRYQGLV